ncbi:hypothetical protein HZB00_01455 [Candidatus Woesearchaeota archaeon]|nr:hypothetical protein [Candidatus Woesearchaeota archaeon]
MHKRPLFKTLAAGAAGALALYSIGPSTNLTKHLQNAPFSVCVDEDTADQFISEHEDAIQSAANNYGVPAELIAATLKTENVGRRKYEDFKDILGTFLGKDVSLGVGQVKISTAQRLEVVSSGKWLSRDEIVTALNDPATNIGYIAQFYAAEMRDLAVHEKDLLLHPDRIVELASRYVRGRKHTSPLDQMIGMNTLLYLTDPSILHKFGREHPEVITALADHYLSQQKNALQKLRVN